jgi:hypothetical protein
VIPGGKSEFEADNSCALARIAIDEVRIKAAVTSALAINSSFISAYDKIKQLDELTSDLPSTQPLIQPLIHLLPARPPANSSIPLVSYPSTGSSISSASEACSQICIDDGVGEDGVCGYDPLLLASTQPHIMIQSTHESSKH